MYSVTLEYPNIDDGYSYDVNLWKNDFIEYLWSKHFNRTYNSLNYLLDDKHGKVYNDLEAQWFANKLDEYSITKEPAFIQFLLNKYEDAARAQFDEECRWEDPDEWWDDLDDDKKEIIMEAYRGY